MRGKKKINFSRLFMVIKNSGYFMIKQFTILKKNVIYFEEYIANVRIKLSFYLIEIDKYDD